ncbi:MAG: hypothetical protein HOO93_17685 [Methyloglobulus sp.]|nr:hypothetical protein [Methyloglobulus sp.]
MSTICPACGSDSVESTESINTIPVVYGNAAKFVEILNKCSVCGESGDFSGVNDEQIDKALEVAKKDSVNKMLDALSINGIKMSYMERALELPARTIARWKIGEVSAATLALLRIIRTFPWLLEVADERFDRTVANYKLMVEASNIVHDALEINKKPHQFIFNNDSYTIYTSIAYQEKPKFSPNSLRPKLEQRHTATGDR